MSAKTYSQLSVMMFIEYFIWGVYFVTMATYLSTIGFSGLEIGSAYNTQCIGAIVSPFFIGMIADRFFSAQKVLGIMHIMGGLFILWASTILTPGAFFTVMLLYMLVYMPTIALTNAISFNQMEDPGKTFPYIRVWGTIGWIVAGLIVGFLKVEDTNVPLKIAAAISIFMGLYSFFLPNTPPKKTDSKVTFGDIIGVKAFKLFKNRSFTIFILASFLICIPLAFYYQYTNLFLNELGMKYAAAKQTMGQMSEILFMIVMPFFFIRLGVKKMLIVGMSAWALRYLLFAYGNIDSLSWMLYGGIILHGVCYDFFFVTGQIYVDKVAPKEVQSSAQGLITLVTYGIGMLIGNWVAGYIVDANKAELGHAWYNVWIAPCIMAVVVLVAFVLLFKENGKKSA